MHKVRRSLSVQEQHFQMPAFEQLEKINAANNQAFLFSGFSHSLKNPLNSIQLASCLLNSYLLEIRNMVNDTDNEPELLRSGFREEKRSLLNDMLQVVQGVSDSALKLDQVVSHLSEIDGSGTRAARSDVDINRLISLCATMAHHQICVHTNSFRLDLDPGLPIVSGNAQRMSHAVLSMLINALLSLPDRSHAVTLSTSCDHAAGLVHIGVRDTGSGIPRELFPQIFEPFFSSWQEHGCFGLGLTVADHIIRAHGGELSIDSEPGKGTCVRVSLPLLSITNDLPPGDCHA